jgi:DNA-binding HxlR family transcriptional regulator
MTRTSLAGVACSIARASDVVADPWTMLIMRDVLVGITRFDDIAEDLGLSRKVLTARLILLVDEGVLYRERYQEHPPRDLYLPTDKGADLYGVLLALMSWGDRWYSGEAGPPAIIHHRDCDTDNTPVVCCGTCGGALTTDNAGPLPGPGRRVGRGTALFGALVRANAVAAEDS